MSSSNKQSAEQLFRDAFERLKKNKPSVLPEGSPVTQNNVAREAGRDPSAFKKDRYPILVLEVQAYVKAVSENTVVQKRKRDNRSRTAKQKLQNWQQQRDKMSSIIAAQNSYIEDLLDEIETLKTGKIVEL